MNKDHYCSLEIAKKLKEAGIEFPKSEKVWAKEITGCGQFKLFGRKDPKALHSLYMTKCCPDVWDAFPAPSLSEILDLLPDMIAIQRVGDQYECWSMSYPSKFGLQFADTAATAAAKMLLEIREKGEPK